MLALITQPPPDISIEGESGADTSTPGAKQVHGLTDWSEQINKDCTYISFDKKLTWDILNFILVISECLISDILVFSFLFP